MHDATSMGITNGVGDLTQQFQPVLRAEFVAASCKIVVEPDGFGVEVFEQQGWPEFVFFVILNGQNVRVIEGLDDLKLASGGTLASSDPLRVDGVRPAAGPGKCAVKRRYV